MSALEFIELLAAKRLIPAQVVAKLERQIKQSPKKVSARSIAKLLVKKGQLTPSQAKRLLEAAPAAPPTPPPPRNDDNELGLAPIEELGLKPDSTSAASQSDDDDLDLVDIDEDDRPRIPVVEPLPEADEPHDVAPAPAGDDWHHDRLETGLDHDEHVLAEADDTARPIAERRRGLAGWFTSRRLSRAPRKFTANRWDSPLMLVGGGALLVLMAVGVALFLFLSRGTGDEAFAAARDQYRQQAYGQAINGFQQFLNDYPDHPQASSARVHIGLARIWNRVERQQWEQALEAVKTELPPLVDQEAFAEARPELASLLPEISEGFADQALASQQIAASEEYLARAQESLEHVNNSVYLPTSVRRGQQARIEEILGKLESIARRINRDRELESTVAHIREAAAQRQIAAAYGLRKQLLKTYPSLEVDERLAQAVADVTASERAAVEPLQNPPQPLTDEPPSASQFRIALAARRGGTVAELGDQVLAFCAHGAVYGLRAVDGEMLWRRPVGLGHDLPPIQWSDGQAQAAFVVDRRRRELVRLDSQTGKTVWRLPCPGQPTQPQLQDGRLWLACQEEQRGHILAVDPADGQVVGGVTLPVPVTVAPAFDSQNERLIQPAAHSTVYVFSTQDWSCQGVTYLGHGPETIAVPPTIVGGAVVVAENPGIDFSLLHILQFGADEPGQLQRMAEPVRVEGQIIVPPQSFGRRLLLTTDRGSIQVLELDPSQPASPLRPVASAVATVPVGTASYHLLDEGRLWVADVQLTGYELQTSRGQLVRKWLNSKGDRFLGPLQRHGATLFHVRQRNGKFGATVAAVVVGAGQDGKRDGETIWEVDLGVPAAGEPFVLRDAQEICVINGNGDLFAAGREAIRTGRINGARQSAQDPLLPPLVETVVLNERQRVICPRPGADRVLIVELSDGEPSLKSVVLDLNGQRTGAIPIAFQQMLAVPTTAGAVYVIDPSTGKTAVTPFQPAMGSGDEVTWQRPAVIDPGDELLAADDRGSLYRLAIENEPTPHLTARLQSPGDAPLVAPPLVLESSIWTVAQGAQHDVLRRLNLEDLQLQNQVELPGHVIWGPRAAGDRALLMTDLRQFVALDGSQQVFVVDTLTAPAVGAPVVYQQGFVVATVDGFLWYLDKSTGKVLHKAEVGESLGTGPIHFSGDRFIVCGGDGTLHVVTLSGAGA
jgi:outer membrane protein assembly factor BamB/TolA-binding protein